MWRLPLCSLLWVGLGEAALLVMAVESVGNMSEYEKNGREAEKKERQLQKGESLLGVEAEMVKVNPGGNDIYPHPQHLLSSLSLSAVHWGKHLSSFNIHSTHSKFQM